MLKKRAVLQGAALFHSRSGNYFSCVGKSGSLVVHKEHIWLRTSRLFSLLLCAAPPALFLQLHTGNSRAAVFVAIHSNKNALSQAVRRRDDRTARHPLHLTYGPDTIPP